MDIVLSPSKGQGRSRNGASVATNVGERTPTKGKRKRPVVDSPIMELETHMDDFDTVYKEAEPVTAPPPIVVAPTPGLPFEVCITVSYTRFYSNGLAVLAIGTRPHSFSWTSSNF
jgi:hypothetical protein